jgi:hypothetical protein
LVPCRDAITKRFLRDLATFAAPAPNPHDVRAATLRASAARSSGLLSGIESPWAARLGNDTIRSSQIPSSFFVRFTQVSFKCPPPLLCQASPWKRTVIHHAIPRQSQESRIILKWAPPGVVPKPAGGPEPQPRAEPHASSHVLMRKLHLQLLDV